MLHPSPNTPGLVRAVQECPSCWHCPACPCREVWGCAASQHWGHSPLPEFLWHTGHGSTGSETCLVSPPARNSSFQQEGPEGPRFPPSICVWNTEPSRSTCTIFTVQLTGKPKTCMERLWVFKHLTLNVTTSTNTAIPIISIYEFKTSIFS